MSSTDSDIRAAQTRVGTTWREDSHKDPEELEREIDETRADVQATLGALEQRLSAEHLLDLTIGRVREHGGAFAGNLGSAARDNPVPLVLTSIGIAWLMMSGRNGNGARGPRHPRSFARAGSLAETGQEASDSGRAPVRSERERLDSSRDAAAHATRSLCARARAVRRRRARPTLARALRRRLPHARATARARRARSRGRRFDRRRIARKRGGKSHVRRGQRSSARQGKGSGPRSYRELAIARGAHRTSKATVVRSCNNGGAEAPPSGSLGTRVLKKGAGDARSEGATTTGRRTTTAPSSVQPRTLERRTPKSKPSSKNDQKSLGNNPSEPRPRKRPSEGGVGKEHSSGGFVGEKSPTSKTPPV